MINGSNFTFLYNSTLDPFESCRISQLQMLQQTEKIAPTGYYILLIGLALLLFYFFAQPYMCRGFQEAFNNKLGWLGTCLVFLAAWILVLGVFQFGEAQFKVLTRITSFLLLCLILLAIYFFVKRRLAK